VPPIYREYFSYSQRHNVDQLLSASILEELVSNLGPDKGCTDGERVAYFPRSLQVTFGIIR
jgi:hypothetical protein